MTEFPHIPSDVSDDNDSNVYHVDFVKSNDNSVDALNPRELDNTLLVEQFLSQLSHPSSFRSSSELGLYIQHALGGVQNDTTPMHGIEWQEHIKELMYDIDLLPREDIESLQSNDPILQELSNRLIASRDQARDLREERRALMLLRELRAGTVVRDEVDDRLDQRWTSLLDRLVFSRKT